MKKQRGIGTMLVLSAIAVGVMGLYDAVTIEETVTVETVTIVRQTVKETVICTGTIAASDGVEVYASAPCVAGDIAVEVGDRVEQGDVLLTIDRTATLAMAVQAGLSQEQSVMASASLPDTVTAPAAGVVSAVHTANGEWLDTNSACITLSEGDGVCVAITVREAALPQIAVGQDVTVSGVAFDKDIYKGTIREIAPSARARTGGETVVDAVVELANGEADESLLLGLTAKAAVTVATQENVLLVPYTCIAQDDEGEYVFRVENGTAYRTPVTIAKELPDGAVVTAGVAHGDVLVCAPEQLTGDRVSITEAGT